MHIKKTHDAQYKELFSNPTLLAELLHSFVDEKFVHELDFSTIKKLNTHFVTGKFRKRARLRIVRHPPANKAIITYF
jgi:hypothetical protein